MAQRMFVCGYYSFVIMGFCTNLYTRTKMMLVFLCLLRFICVNIYIEYRENGQTFTHLSYRHVVKCMLDACADRHIEVPEVPGVIQ